MYVYKQTEENCFTVGFYIPNTHPDDGFYRESDYNNSNAAAQRVHYLNGGNLDAWNGVVTVSTLEA